LLQNYEEQKSVLTTTARSMRHGEKLHSENSKKKTKLQRHTLYVLHNWKVIMNVFFQNYTSTSKIIIPGHN